MHLIKVAFLLTFLALCLRHQAEAAISVKLNKYLSCAEVFSDGVAKLIENSVTGIKVLADCVEFKPELKLNGSIIRFIKLAYQFVHKIVSEEPNCLIGLFTSTASLIRPSIAEFKKQDCINAEL